MLFVEFRRLNFFSFIAGAGLKRASPWMHSGRPSEVFKMYCVGPVLYLLVVDPIIPAVVTKKRAHCFSSQ